MRVIGVVVGGCWRVVRLGWRLLVLTTGFPSRFLRKIVWRCQCKGQMDDGETELVFQIAAAGSQLSKAMANGDIAGGRQGLTAVRNVVSTIRRGRPVATDHPSVPVRPNGRTRFVVDSLFLAGAKKFLVGRHRDQHMGIRERFHYCTGIKLDERTYALTHIVPVAFAEQSAVHLRVENESNIAALASLDRWGTPLVAHFHSHPGCGPNATFPSSLDRRFQERLECGSHIAIGAIYSQDGYVRFFAGDESRFEVRVFGNQVKEIENNVYKIELDDESLPIANIGGTIG